MENQAEKIRDRYSRLELLIYTVGWLIIFGVPLFTYLSDLMQGGAPRLVTEHLKHIESADRTHAVVGGEVIPVGEKFRKDFTTYIKVHVNHLS